MSMSKYMRPRGERREIRSLAGRFRGGKLAPVMAVPFRESESGTVTQSVVYQLDPIAGEMITEITAEIIAVFVPTPAIDALKSPLDDYPGNAEVVRQKLLSGSPLFGLEVEGEISKRLGVVPRSVSGVKYVNEVARIAHNVAVNFLRKRKYVKAAQLLSSSTIVTPCLIGQTVLERLNGVLDPEDRVNGAVDLNMSITGFQVPISSVEYDSFGSNKPAPSGYSGSVPSGSWGDYTWGGKVWADIPDHQAGDGSISLADFYTAEAQDRITREMRSLVDANPQYGEELVLRYAAGLSVDVGAQPFVVYQNTRTFGVGIQRAMDGANLDVSQSNLATHLEFTVPIPSSEFGGILITFAAVKPDEALASQPHPILSEEWGVINYPADELAIDPVPVTIRELNADCAQVDEEIIVLYTGYNHMKKTYINYGFNRHLDPATVAAKTALWQLEVPMSVTPESVIYPESLNHYPFADQLAEVCRYTISTTALINTPVVFGPTPVEELAVIETSNVFQDEE